jgi:hypothetical protein
MKIDWDEIPAAAGIRPGSSQEGVCGNKMSAVLVTTAPDAIFDRKTHWHDNEQMLVGRVTLVDDKEFDCGPGEATSYSSRRDRVMPLSASATKARCITNFSPRPARISFQAGWVVRSFASTEPTRYGSPNVAIRSIPQKNSTRFSSIFGSRSP